MTSGKSDIFLVVRVTHAVLLALWSHVLQDSSISFQDAFSFLALSFSPVHQLAVSMSIPSLLETLSKYNVVIFKSCLSPSKPSKFVSYSEQLTQAVAVER